MSANRYKLICLNPLGEEVFTIEGYSDLAEAQAMLNTLTRAEGPPNIWHLESVFDN